MDLRDSPGERHGKGCSRDFPILLSGALLGRDITKAGMGLLASPPGNTLSAHPSADVHPPHGSLCWSLGLLSRSHVTQDSLKFAT